MILWSSAPIIILLIKFVVLVDIIPLLFQMFLELLVVNVTIALVYDPVYSILYIRWEVVHISVRLINLIDELVVFSLAATASSVERRLILGAWTLVILTWAFVILSFLGLVVLLKMAAVKVLVLILIGSWPIAFSLKLLFFPSRNHIISVSHIHVVSVREAYSCLLLIKMGIWIFVNFNPCQSWRRLLHVLHQRILAIVLKSGRWRFVIKSLT